MDTPTLKAFLAVAETGSFSRAAERLHRDHPAVAMSPPWSRRWPRVCSSIGRKVTPTEAGRA